MPLKRSKVLSRLFQTTKAGRPAESAERQAIDNLVSQQNGRFLSPWESDMLKAYFVHVRNPHGHGAGNQPPLVLTPYQTEWAIETAMAWIKNLVRRS